MRLEVLPVVEGTGGAQPGVGPQGGTLRDDREDLLGAELAREQQRPVAAHGPPEERDLAGIPRLALQEGQEVLDDHGTGVHSSPARVPVVVAAVDRGERQPRGLGVALQVQDPEGVTGVAALAVQHHDDRLTVGAGVGLLGDPPCDLAPRPVRARQ